jgi:septal ring factor EnvC (AmiA/AmiB activator)
MNETVNVRKDLLNRLLNELHELKSELAEYRDENERDKATIRKDVHEAMEKANTAAERESAEREPAESDESGSGDVSTTPMQQLLEAGEDGVLGDVTARVDRARVIAENFGQWATKTPNGLVIRDGLKNLIEAVTGERLAWSQVNRAREALAEFTNGAIGLKKTRKHGWVLIAQPDDHRYRSLLASGG